LVRTDLDAMGLGPRLDATVFSSEVGVRKPDPRIFREAMSRLSAEPAETLFVGDRLYDDVSGAQAVGMRAILTRQFRQEDDPDHHPDAVIDHITQLPDAIARLNRTS
jgi:putative hydrolase of the HAD superfamily